jgi:hypothetical protein
MHALSALEILSHNGETVVGSFTDLALGRLAIRRYQKASTLEGVKEEQWHRLGWFLKTRPLAR